MEVGEGAASYLSGVLNLHPKNQVGISVRIVAHIGLGAHPRWHRAAEARLLRDTESGIPLGGIHYIRETAERARIRARLGGASTLFVV